MRFILVVLSQMQLKIMQRENVPLFIVFLTIIAASTGDFPLQLATNFRSSLLPALDHCSCLYLRESFCLYQYQ